jgi:hypothetical protein
MAIVATPAVGESGRHDRALTVVVDEIEINGGVVMKEKIGGADGRGRKTTTSVQEIAVSTTREERR